VVAAVPRPGHRSHRRGGSPDRSRDIWGGDAADDRACRATVPARLRPHRDHDDRPPRDADGPRPHRRPRPTDGRAAVRAARGCYDALRAEATVTAPRRATSRWPNFVLRAGQRGLAVTARPEALPRPLPRPPVAAGDRAGPGHPSGALPVDGDRAFAFLARASSHSNTKLRDVAQQLVDEVKQPG
jgi:hypothetical protein